MRVAGKAFMAGMFGTLGVATGVLIITGATAFIGRKAIKNMIREVETELREKSDSLLNKVLGDEGPDL